VKRIAFHTLGCKLNFSETAEISREFHRHGFKKVDYKDEADIYVLNTCSVTENADKEARKLIRQAKRRNYDSAIVVIGCYAQLNPDEIVAIDGVNLILGAEEKFNILEHLAQLELNCDTKIIQSELNHNQNFVSSYSSGERTRSFLKIQDGCDYNCSFCTIPLARGESRSDTIENTMKTAREIANTDTCEIVLTGVNIGDFGKGSTASFFDLIQQLDNLNQIDRIRISSIEPNLLTDEIIEFCLSSNRLMPHFHIPLQSGSNKILMDMRRRYKRNLYADRVFRIKSLNPDACIGTDVIVGFPGETNDDFMDTYNFLNDLDISYLHVFTYSERPNTDAIDLGKIVPGKIRAERSKMLHILSDKKQHYFQSQFIGETRPVLFEHVKNGKLVGHTDNYIQVRIEDRPELINTIHKINLTKNKINFIEGELL